MMNHIQRFLRFMRLTDPDQTLSLTSVGLIIVLVKIAMADQPSLTELGALLLSLFSYNYKKVLASKGTSSEVEAAVSELKDMAQRLTIVENRTNPNGVLTNRGR